MDRSKADPDGMTNNKKGKNKDKIKAKAKYRDSSLRSE
jgi:hypothetical protein